MAQFQGHEPGVPRFQQDWTNRAMDLDDEADDPSREGPVFEHQELPWCAVALGVLRGENFESVNRHEQPYLTTPSARRPMHRSGENEGAPDAIGPQPNAIALTGRHLGIAPECDDFLYLDTAVRASSVPRHRPASDMEQSNGETADDRGR
jgi:hypothetical protein